MNNKNTSSSYDRIYSQLEAGESAVFEPYVDCVDHTVSRETFSLLRYNDLDMLITFPQPSKDDLPSYYESEDYISHTDSKRNLTENLYQKVKNHSLNRKLKLVNRIQGSTGSLLDIGCGTGDFLNTCKEGGWQVCGIEPNGKARSLAAQKLGKKDGLYSSLDELTQSQSQRFDIISLWHVLEHVPDLMTYIAEIKGLLNPNGVIVIAVPNYKSYDANYYGSDWAAFDVPRHLWHFSRDSIQSIFSKFDLKVIKELPLVFDSFYVSLLSEKIKTGKPNFISAFYRGLRSNLLARKSGEYSSVIYLIK